MIGINKLFAILEKTGTSSPSAIPTHNFVIIHKIEEKEKRATENQEINLASLLIAAQVEQ